MRLEMTEFRGSARKKGSYRTLKDARDLMKQGTKNRDRFTEDTKVLGEEYYAEFRFVPRRYSRGTEEWVVPGREKAVFKAGGKRY